MWRPKHSEKYPCQQQRFRKPAGQRPSPSLVRDGRSERWCRPAHKPHKVNETVTVYYRFHPLSGTRATTLESRSHRGEPIVVVADSEGQRYHLPLWMTAPDAAQWSLRDRPPLSHSALSELRDLIAAWSAEPAPPATGDRDEISKAREVAKDADVRAAAPSQPARGCETGGGGRSGGADCGGDGRHRSGRERWSLLLPYWPRVSAPLPVKNSEVVSKNTKSSALNCERRRANSSSSMRSLVRRGEGAPGSGSPSASPSQPIARYRCCSSSPAAPSMAWSRRQRRALRSEPKTMRRCSTVMNTTRSTST